MSLVRLLLASVIGYLSGTVPSADVAARLVSGGHIDLRRAGSRNPGGMNAARLLGNRVGRLVVVTDVAKGYAGCAAGRRVAGDVGAHIAGTAAVLGHCYPAWTRFRGGKGLATSFGQCLYTFPAAAPIDLALALGIARIPGLRRAGTVATAVASGVWLLLSVIWWRRQLPNSWGPRPTATLPIANAATVAIVGSRLVAAHRQGHPDELAPDHAGSDE